jgi:hypothetical protein
VSSIFEPETRTVHVYRGDYQARLTRLEAQILKAAKSSDGETVMLDETPENERLAAEYEALAEQAADHRVTVTVQALPRRVSKALRAAHPPRKMGDEGVSDLQARGDMVFGVNEETFREALVRGGEVEIDGQPVTYRSVVDPELTPDDFDALSEGAFTAIYAAAMDLTFGFSSDPKAVSLASPSTLPSDAT